MFSLCDFCSIRKCLRGRFFLAGHQDNFQLVPFLNIHNVLLLRSHFLCMLFFYCFAMDNLSEPESPEMDTSSWDTKAQNKLGPVKPFADFSLFC